MLCIIYIKGNTGKKGLSLNDAGQGNIHMVGVYLLLCTNITTNLHFNTMHIHYLKASVDKSLDIASPGHPLHSLTKLPSRCWRLNWGRICNQTNVVIGRIQFFTGCQTEGLSFLLTVSQRPPSPLAACLSPRSSSQHGSLLLECQQARKTERVVGGGWAGGRERERQTDLSSWVL